MKSEVGGKAKPSRNRLAGHVKVAIKASGLRPAANQSCENSQRCVALQELVELSYAEGVVMTDAGYPMAHSWVVDAQGKDHDLTAHPMPKVVCRRVYDKHQVRQRIIESGVYEQMDAEWCNYMLNAALMNIPTDLPYEKIRQRLNYLCGIEE